MLYESDVSSLLSQWETRMINQSPEYKDALRDCMYDLNRLISKSVDEELSYNDFLAQEADNYLSSIEAHDKLFYA